VITVTYFVSRKGIWPVEIIYVITNPEDSVPDLWRTQLDVEWAGKTRKPEVVLFRCSETVGHIVGNDEYVNVLFKSKLQIIC